MEDRCIVCGEVITEGYGWVCPRCSKERINMDKKIRHFLIIDPDKNMLLVSSNTSSLGEVIKTARSNGEQIITNETMGELVANVKRYLKGEFENGDNNC